MRTKRFHALAALVPVTLLFTNCSSQSRLWRLSPFSGLEESGSDRMNLWPLAFSAGGGTSILWPLVDFDQQGFAVRPLVSHDKSDWDFLYPLSHFNGDSGNGWALTYYQYEKNVGLAPLFNFGPEVNYVIPAYWGHDEKQGTIWGVFPIAGSFGTFGYAGTAWWNLKEPGGFGLFPVFNWSTLKWVGPVWWNDPGPDDKTAYGFFPVVWKWGDPTRLLALPFYYGDAERDAVFPLYYGDDERRFVAPCYYSDSTRRIVAPFYFGQHEEGHDLTALLVPPTWWDTRGESESHVVFPFYTHFAREDYDLTAWFPLYATKTTAAGSHWFSPIGDGWRTGKSAGLDLYPLWYSAHDARVSRQMLLPFYYYRERDNDRLLLTPVGGRGWSANGESRFVNVLGPVYHHSKGVDSETTAIAWPLYERERIGETTKTSSIPFFGSTKKPTGRDTWFLAGLGRSVTQDESNSFRLFPLVASSNAAETPDLLYDLTIAGGRSHGDEWSRRFLPLFWASGDKRRGTTDAWSLCGLARSVEQPGASSMRLFPLYSQSRGAESPDPLFDFTLAGLHSNEDAWSAHLFPLYWGRGDATDSTHTGPLGLARVATTDRGSAWRLWPLASYSSDPAADGWIDELSLFRHERTDTGTRDWAIPFFVSSRQGEESDLHVIPPLFRRHVTAQGASLRLWPLVTTSNADGLDDWFDPFTLVAAHTRPEKTHVHVGTDLVFGLDRTGEGKRTWDARVLTLCDFGHSERSADAAQPELAEQRIAAQNGDAAIRRPPVTVERDHAGFLFDWFLVENSKTLDATGESHDESHWRMPLVHEYKRTPEKKEWDLLCYAVHSKESGDQKSFSVLGYGYRSEKKGDSTCRDIFPFVTWDSAPQSKHVSFLWRLFDYRSEGDRKGGHVLFVPWGEPVNEARSFAAGAPP